MNICDVDILGQEPKFGIYTQISFIYGVQNPTNHSSIIKALTAGLHRLSESFPWIAGQLRNDGTTESNSGVFKISSFESIPRLIVKDLRGDVSAPTMATLRTQNFPVSMLDEALIAPCKTLPMLGPKTLGVDPSPVFLAQVNFIESGLIVTFNGQHQAVDMTGLGQIILLLSKACNNDKFSEEELRIGNLPRHNIIPLLDEADFNASLMNHAEVTPEAKEATSRRTAPPPNSTWTTFTFSTSSLAALKDLATSRKSSAVDYITTDDALCAFIWQRVSHARLHRLGDKVITTFGRAIDPRRYLGISPTYPGMLANKVHCPYTVSELLNQPLGAVASKLRTAVDPKTSTAGHDTRALATAFHHAVDKNKLDINAKVDASVDLTLSSWAQMPFCNLEFGMGLGKPEAVRRPRFEAYEGLAYFLPKTKAGEIVLLICLRDEDLDVLRRDEEWNKHVTEAG